MKLLDGRGSSDLNGGGFPRIERPPDPVVPTASRPVRSYEELDGGEGRGVFFRPDRYGAGDLAPLRGVVVVHLEGRAHECALLDVSSSGVALLWPDGLPVRRGDRLAIALRFERHEAFRGSATVGSVREQGSTVVGLGFDDFLLDIGEILHLRDFHVWEHQAAGTIVGEERWGMPAGDRFKSLVSELRLFLEDAQEQLGALERQLPWHALQDPGSPARAAAFDMVLRDVVPEVVRRGNAIDAAVRQLPDAHATATAVAWSRRHLDAFFMQSPICHRARFKPFGYPGDYEVMNFIYQPVFQGPTLFAGAIGHAFAACVAARAVRCRKDLVRDELRDLLASRASGEPIRVLSIAAGPAQELVELFQDRGALRGPVEVVLFDQDKNALAHAWRRLRGVAEGALRRTVRFTFLHESIKRLLRDAELFEPFGKFDLIYSCGLYDYLQTRTGVVLARRLASCLAPGGRLLIANMVDHSTRWMMEHHLEWNLIYRTHAELLELGDRAVPGAPVRILEEASGANPFFELVRT